MNALAESLESFQPEASSSHEIFLEEYLTNVWNSLLLSTTSDLQHA